MLKSCDLMLAHSNQTSQVFGQGSFAARGLPVFVAASAFGNLVATTYANSRGKAFFLRSEFLLTRLVEQEIARQKILPFSSYWARNSPYGTPVGALTFHWFFSVILILSSEFEAALVSVDIITPHMLTTRI